jgi:hypothetical protein
MGGELFAYVITGVGYHLTGLFKLQKLTRAFLAQAR